MKCIETNGFMFMEAPTNEAKYSVEIPAAPPIPEPSIALYECSLQVQHLQVVDDPVLATDPT